MAKKNSLNVAQLEVAQSTPIIENKSSNSEIELLELIEKGDFANLLKLKSTDFLYKGISSPKLNNEREEQINNGIDFINSNLGVFTDLDPKVLSLAKFWENKNVRNKIKEYIYKEGEEKGFDGYDYMINMLAPGLETVENLLETINRMKYSIRTYYKPREGSIKKGESIVIEIDGTKYSIDSNRLTYLKNNFEDRDQLVAEIIKVAKPLNDVISI